MVKNKFAPKPISTLATLLTFTLAGVTMAPAAQGTETTSPVESQSTSAETTSAEELATIEQIEAELQALNDLSEEELAQMIETGQASDDVTARVPVPLIVYGIGCAIAGGSAMFATDWSSANNVAWTLAGALASCIPAASQAKLVTVILNNRATIGRALKGVGAGAAGSTLCGSSQC